MQIVCRFSGDVKSYLSDPGSLLSERERRCPFCDRAHRLRVHGWYRRYVIVAGAQEAVEIPVRRLLCPQVGRTVSLLPAFCLPRRQLGAGLVGRFLEALVIGGQSLRGALCTAWPAAPRHHSLAQVLVRRVRARSPHLRDYLARTRARMAERTPSAGNRHRDLCSVFDALRAGFDDVGTAFEHHGRLFHEAFQLPLI